jgi:hypothetical protein
LRHGALCEERGREVPHQADQRCEQSQYDHGRDGGKREDHHEGKVGFGGGSSVQGLLKSRSNGGSGSSGMMDLSSSKGGVRGGAGNEGYEDFTVRRRQRDGLATAPSSWW